VDPLHAAIGVAEDEVDAPADDVSRRREQRPAQQQALAGLDVLVVGEGESFVGDQVVVNLVDVRVDVINLPRW
jgi:hypothetical protein